MKGFRKARFSILCLFLHVVSLGCTRVPSGPFIKLEFSHHGMTTFGSWELSIKANGQAELSVETSEGDSKRTFRVDDGKILQIERVILEKKFFRLPELIGARVPDAALRTMSVTCWDGDDWSEKTVVIEYLDERNFDSQARRALEVWHTVRSTFDDEEAFSDLELDERLMKRTRGR